MATQIWKWMQAGARRSRKHRRGMTLVEIMVVVAIIGLMTAAVAVAVIPQLTKAKIDTAKNDISTLNNALKTYYIRAGKYPDTSTGLKVLVDQQYIEKEPKDPWGNDYVYTLQGGKPVITSYGADGQAGGAGFDEDITNAPAAGAK